MTEPAYPAARAVAARVTAHFEEHLAAARRDRVADLAYAPGPVHVEAMIDTAFWASVRREEGLAPTISLAFLPPEQSMRPMRFERSLPLAPGPLTRLAPAVERPGIHLGVWPNGDGTLNVWGTSHTLPTLCFVLEVIAPGLLVVKHRRGREVGKFVNVVVLEGDQIKIVDERGASLPDCPELVSSLLGFDTPASWVDSVNVLVQLAVSMRNHHRGGILLVVPAGTTRWRESIVQPMSYGLTPAFTELRDLMGHDVGERVRLQWRESLRSAVDEVAGLTAVDGATVISTQYEVLGFGAKMARRRGSPRVEQIAVTEPIEGHGVRFVAPSELGGTRHLSAAQFILDQHDAVALVASQDGPFTIFAWSPCEERVHAHRVETLLL